MCTAEYVRGVHARIRDNLVSLLGEQQGTFPVEVQELLQEDGTVRRSVLSEIRKVCAIAQADRPGVQSPASSISLYELLVRRASLDKSDLKTALQRCKAANKGAGGRKAFHISGDRVLCDKGPAPFTVRVSSCVAQ